MIETDLDALCRFNPQANSPIDEIMLIRIIHTNSPPDLIVLALVHIKKHIIKRIKVKVDRMPVSHFVLDEVTRAVPDK